MDQVRVAQFVCPVTMKEMNGNIRFAFISSCGCVFSEKALTELPDSEPCTLCNKPYSKDCIVPINGTVEQVEALKKKLEERKNKIKESGKVRERCGSSGVLPCDVMELCLPY
jgi:hypothetical protein